MIETVQAERRKQRKRLVAALIASLIIHFCILLVAFILLTLAPPRKARPAPKAELKPVELTILPAPAPTPPPKEDKREFFDSSQGNVSEKAPENAEFESDRNTTAASERPARSDAPVPTQDGDEAPGLTLTAKNLSLGPRPAPSAPSPASPPRPEAKPEEKTTEKKPEEKTETLKEAKTEPTPRPTPKPDDGELALLDPAKPPPKPEAPKPPKPAPPVPPSLPGYQPQQRLTRLTGGIDSRGRSSVNSVATPLGRYKKMLSDAIGSRWYYYVQDMLDLVGIGTVQLRFVVDESGKVERVQVLKNTSNESLASCSVRSVIEAEIPPIPPELANTLPQRKLEIDYSFTIIGAR